jgi:hypothetical protein
MAAPKGNKFAIGNEGGRPLKYKNVGELQKLIDQYFESCWQEFEIKDEDGNVVDMGRRQIRPYTITGLCLALDTTRELLLNYQDKEEYHDTITRAKMKCHNYAEEFLFTSKNPTGAMFNLKNNYGWKDKNETELTGKDGGAVEINVNIVEED